MSAPNMIKATKAVTTIATVNGPVVVGYVTQTSLWIRVAISDEMEIVGCPGCEFTPHAQLAKRSAKMYRGEVQTCGTCMSEGDVRITP